MLHANADHTEFNVDVFIDVIKVHHMIIISLKALDLFRKEKRYNLPVFTYSLLPTHCTEAL